MATTIIPAYQPLFSVDSGQIGTGSTGVSVANNSSATSASTTGTNLYKIEMTPGIWIWSINARFASNSTGIRRITVHASSGNISATPYWSLSRSADPNTYTFMHLTLLINATEDTTWYVNATQNSGGNLTCICYANYVKLA